MIFTGWISYLARGGGAEMERDGKKEEEDIWEVAGMGFGRGRRGSVGCSVKRRFSTRSLSLNYG